MGSSVIFKICFKNEAISSSVGSVICSTVASEECNQGSNSNCAIESEVAAQLPYGESSTRNITRTQSTSFTADNLRSFYSSITKGDGTKIDQRARFEPFNKMDKHLVTAPYAVSLIAQLTLIGTKRDYNMSGLLTEYKYLVAPGSFRASLSQIGDEAFKAFREANRTMYSIELQTSQYKELLNKILKIVFSKNSDKGITIFLPSVLNRTLGIVEESRKEIESVINGFDVVKNVLDEITIASFAKQGQTEEMAEQIKNLKRLEELKMKQTEQRLKKEKEKIENINRHLTEQTNLFDDARAKLKREEEENSELKLSKPVKIELTTNKKR